jgi:antitoxin component of MazEF toxin-antitoxin module
MVLPKDITVAWEGPGYSQKPQDISENYSASEHRLKALIAQRRSKICKALNGFPEPTIMGKCVVRNAERSTKFISDISRKIIKVGPSSLAVILPKEWTAKNGLAAGDVVTLRSINDKLLITPEKGPPEASGRTLEIQYSSLARRGLDVSSVILCGIIKGLDSITFREVDRSVEAALRPYGDLLEVSSEDDNIVVKFMVGEATYDDYALLKRMLSVIVRLLDHIASLLEGEGQEDLVNTVSVELKKYGYALARRILSGQSAVDSDVVVKFSTGVVLGLIGELLLSEAIRLRERGVDLVSSRPLIPLVMSLKETLQEAIGGLVYRSPTRSMKAREAVRRLKRSLRVIKSYSSLPNEGLTGLIDALDNVTRLINKIVEMDICNVLESLT